MNFDNFLENVSLTLTKRQVAYGSPRPGHTAIAKAWSWWLSAILDTPVVLKPTDVAAMMALLKLARLANSADSPSRMDSILDLGGYAAVMAHLEEEDEFGEEDFE